MKKIYNKFGDIKEKIGDAFTDFVKPAYDFFGDIKNKISAAYEDYVKPIYDTFSDIADLVLGAYNTLSDAFGTFTDWLSGLNLGN